MKPQLFFCFFIIASLSCWGQQDTSAVESVLLQEDSVSKITEDSAVRERKHSPALAGGLSAALPGLGQAYNKKYWKIPINYAGFAAAGYFIYYFNDKYVSYRTEYRHRLNGETNLFNPDMQNLDTDNINSLKQYYQKNMEISIIALVIWYFVNILDAIVDAHLMSFDISDNLALRVAPNINTNPNLGLRQTVGLSFSLNLKLFKP